MELFSWVKKQFKSTKPRTNKYRKIAELANQAGEVDGRHYTTYSDEVEALARENLDGAIALLLRLIAAAEAQAKIDKVTAPPEYYERLAALYHTKQQYDNEIAILQRVLSTQPTYAKNSTRLLAKLDEAKKLAESAN